jgi:hypothetical protein
MLLFGYSYDSGRCAYCTALKFLSSSSVLEVIPMTCVLIPHHYKDRPHYYLYSTTPTTAYVPGTGTEKALSTVLSGLN